jgi:hypothetical protein
MRKSNILPKRGLGSYSIRIDEIFLMLFITSLKSAPFGRTCQTLSSGRNITLLTPGLPKDRQLYRLLM